MCLDHNVITFIRMIQDLYMQVNRGGVALYTYRSTSGAYILVYSVILGGMLDCQLLSVISLFKTASIQSTLAV